MRCLALRVLSLLCVAGASAIAQNVTGSISGVARDPSASVVPDLTVQAINEGTGARFETMTTRTGSTPFVPSRSDSTPWLRNLQALNASRQKVYVCR